MLHQKDTFILVILGSTAMLDSQSTNQKNMISYNNYSLSSYSILIKRLATHYLGIDKQHVCIFAKSENQDFNIANLASINPIISVQLTLNEIYKTKISESELDFTLFKNIDDLFYKMGRYFNKFGNNSDKNIILFMYDHGDEDSFGELNYLNFYLNFIQKIPHSSLQIFNESCKSKSMILKIKRYYTISDIINSGTSFKTLFFAAKIANDKYPQGGLKECNELISLENKYYEFFQKEDIPYYFLININDQLHEKEIKQINDKFTSSFADKTDLFFMIFESFKKQLMISTIPQSYTFIHSAFQKGIDGVKKALSKINCTFSELLIIFKDLIINGLGFPDFLHEKHKNHLIITSSNDRGLSPSFGTINAKYIDDINCKIIPGSPAMGAFVIEGLMFNSSLLNQSKSESLRINIRNIEKLVYGNDDKFIMEYAVQCPKNRFISGETNKKLWIRLDINYWKSDDISEVDSSLKADIDDKIKCIQSIMKNIGFSLASKCQIDFSKDGYCITKKMQPYFQNQKRNVIGIRLVNRDQDANYKFEEDHFTEEGYYSDDSHSYSSNNSSQNSSSDDIIPDSSLNLNKIDYNMPLNQSYINMVKKKINKLDQMYFPEAIFEVFQNELDEIVKCLKLQNKSNQKNQDLIYIRSELNEWTGYFLPTYLLENKKDELFSLFDEFTNKYQLTHDHIKSIFCYCMNVADQIVTPLKYKSKKTAFFEFRLKKNHS